jgi:hypothetical protein
VGGGGMGEGKLGRSARLRPLTTRAGWELNTASNSGTLASDWQNTQSPEAVFTVRN